jgi:hypothetical protein
MLDEAQKIEAQRVTNEAGCYKNARPSFSYIGLPLLKWLYIYVYTYIHKQYHVDLWVIDKYGQNQITHYISSLCVFSLKGTSASFRMHVWSTSRG